MALTRLITYGMEALLEIYYQTTFVATAPSFGNSGVDGQHGWQFTFLGEGFYWTLDSSIGQGRASFIVNIPENGPSGADTPSILTFGDGGVATKALQLYYSAGNWYVYAGATQLGTFADTIRYKGFTHVGVDFKVDASAGWAYVYFDGAAQLSYSGQTDQGASDFDTVCLGPNTSGDNWLQYLMLDNFFFEESTGEGAAACPPMSLFRAIQPNGDGNYSDWVGSDADSVSNYLHVDDALAASSGATLMATYVEGTTGGEKDSYVMENPNASTVGYGWITDATDILSVRHYVVGQEDAGTTEQYMPFLRYSGTDLDGTPVDLVTGRGSYSERFPTPPGGGSWSLAILDALEAGIGVV